MFPTDYEFSLPQCHSEALPRANILIQRVLLQMWMYQLFEFIKSLRCHAKIVEEHHPVPPLHYWYFHIQFAPFVNRWTNCILTLNFTSCS